MWVDFESFLREKFENNNGRTIAIDSYSGFLVAFKETYRTKLTFVRRSCRIQVARYK